MEPRCWAVRASPSLTRRPHPGPLRRPVLGSAPLPSTDHHFLFIFPGGSEHCCEKGSMGFLTHKAPKRQYFDDLSINDQKHVDFISFRIHLGMKIKGKCAWQSTARASSTPWQGLRCLANLKWGSPFSLHSPTRLMLIWTRPATARGRDPVKKGRGRGEAGKRGGGQILLTGLCLAQKKTDLSSESVQGKSCQVPLPLCP